MKFPNARKAGARLPRKQGNAGGIRRFRDCRKMGGEALRPPPLYLRRRGLWSSYSISARVIPQSEAPRSVMAASR